MPVFAWKGLDSAGRITRGTIFSRSVNDLEKTLLKNNVALLTARPSFFARQVSQKERLVFFSHLAPLLKAHIPIYNALLIVATQTAKSHVKIVIEDCAALVAQGQSLSTALRMHALADEFSSTMIAIGEQTATVADMIAALLEHMLLIDAFKKKVRSALMGPLITLLFFLCVMVGIFTLVIPRFEGYFSSLNADLPLITTIILGISRFIRSWHMACLTIFIGLSGMFLWYFFTTIKGQLLKQKLFFNTPGVSHIYWSLHKTQFLTMLSMLCNNGVCLGQALELIDNTISSPPAKEEVGLIRNAIAAGNSLSYAVGQSRFSCQESEAYIAIGETSGSLAAMIDHAATIRRQRVYDTISRWVIFIQPLVLILLGLLIAALIFAIYMPLLTLSSII